MKALPNSTRMNFLAADPAAATAPDTLQEYIADFYDAYVVQVRGALLFGIVVYSCFLILDYFLMPERMLELSANRAVVSLAALAVLLWSYRPGFRRIFRLSLFASHLIVGAGSIHLGLINSIYDSSLYSVLIFYALIPRAQFLYTVVANSMLVVGYFLAHYFLSNPPFLELLYETLLLNAASIVSFLAAYLKESSGRKEFVRKRKLKATSQQLTDARTTIYNQYRVLEKRHQELEEDLLLARKTQEQFVPRRFMNVPGIDCFAHYRPVDQVGGDYFDFIDLKERGVGVFISDVSGHGVPAALITAMLKMTTSLHGPEAESPARFLTLLNRSLYRKTGTHFLTAFMAFIEPKSQRIVFANAGHCCPILYRRSTGEYTELDSYGMIMGLLPFDEYEDNALPLKPEDRLIFYTDGVTESRNDEGEMFGEKRLRKFLEDYNQLDAEQTVNGLLNALNSFRGDQEPEDDIALICLDVIGEIGMPMSHP